MNKWLLPRLTKCSRQAKEDRHSCLFDELPLIENRNLKSKISTRVLGVDTSLRSSGVALIETSGSTLTAIEYERVKNPVGRSLSKCLNCLYSAITEIIDHGKPDAVVVEGIFYCKNVKTAVILGEARGVVIAAAAVAGIPVYEYSPRSVKQAVVGFGAASKEQVRKMVITILKLNDVPDEDASDALAIAICHAHRATRLAAQTIKEI